MREFSPTHFGYSFFFRAVIKLAGAVWPESVTLTVGTLLGCLRYFFLAEPIGAYIPCDTF